MKRERKLEQKRELERDSLALNKPLSSLVQRKSCSIIRRPSTCKRHTYQSLSEALYLTASAVKRTNKPSQVRRNRPAVGPTFKIRAQQSLIWPSQSSARSRRSIRPQILPSSVESREGALFLSRVL